MAKGLHWIKVKNPKTPAVTREAEEDWGGDTSAWRDGPVAPNDRALPHVAVFAQWPVAIRQSNH